ncbi:MAG: AbrB/MazE/SpoVT family DNA-binding domain-containing protein [Acidimicrobiia bacterium]
MKPTGVTRRVDRLGRVVLPADVRRSFGIGEGDLVDISVDGHVIVLAKVEPGCVFCSATTELLELADRHVCRACATEIGRLAG